MIGQKIRLGDLLVDEGLISNDELMKALSVQKEYRMKGEFKKIGEVLVDEGFITEKQMSVVLAKQLHLEFVDLYGEDINYDLMASFPLNLIKTTKVLPFRETEDYIYVATSDPLDYDSLEMVERMIVRKPVKTYISQSIDILNIIERLEIVTSTKNLVEQVKKELSGGANVVIEAENTAIAKLTELILQTAINQRASDVHIEPEKHGFSVRARIDGVLKEIFTFEKAIQGALISKIKLLSNLDISEKRKSQDGRFGLEFDGGKFYDFRVSTTPTLLGESIVMRILDQQKILLKLEELGMTEHNLLQFQKLIQSPFGIVFVTGPTGSGKTTTLYAALNDIKSLENKVITVEDPVEYQIPLVQQIQVNTKVGYGFADILRTTLRQDPDIIMIGEVRDAETLNAAVQASLTGHLVLATLHTNDAVSAITRMVQMGAESYLVADSLIGVVAQRLVRRVCPHCKEEYKPTPDIMIRVGHYFEEHSKFFIGKGCKQCNMSGYSGREMVSEVFSIDDEISNMIAKSEDKYKILEKAKVKGYKTLVDDVVDKVKNGVTTISELLRVAKI